MPNVHASNFDEVYQPRVIERNGFNIQIACLTTLFLCMLAMSAFRTIVERTSDDTDDTTERRVAKVD